MSLRELLRRSETIVGLVHDFRKILKVPLLRIVRRRRIARYVMSHQVRKLQLGAGPDAVEGWLTTDINPLSSPVAYLDATERFPFPDGAFDYIHSEHMIEHLSWQQGQFMLCECRRVLKPGGTVRIATPDLGFLVGLFAQDGDESKERFIHWAIDTFPRGIKAYKPSIVINTSLGDYWAHKLVYDGELLEMAMREAGLTDVRRCLPGQSADENLRGMEVHRKNCGDYEIANLETMVYEGMRPNSRSRA